MFYGYLYRLKKGFFPTKGWAMFDTLVFLAVAIWAFASGGDTATMCALGLFMIALWYGGVLVYRVNRDTKIAGQVQATRQQPPARVPVARTNPESYRLSVPPPQPKQEGM